MRLVIGEAMRYETGVQSAKASYTVGKVSQLSVTVPLADLPIDAVRRQKAWLYHEGQLLFVGQVVDTPEVELDAEGAEEVRLVVRDTLSYLACYHARVADGHFQNLNVVTTIVPSLLFGTGWTVDGTAVPTGNAVTTVDTRSSKNRWEQIEKAVKAVPKVAVRVDTQVDALVLEVGEFQDVVTRLSTDNLTAFGYDVTDFDAFGYVVAYGGKTSNDVLSLYNAGANPTFVASGLGARYEVVRFDNEWALRDKQATVTCGQSVTFSTIKTKNDEVVPIGSALWLEAQWALIQASVRWLQQHQPDYTVYTMRALLPSLPKIGDWARVSLRRDTSVLDRFGNVVQVAGIDVEADVKLTKIEVDYSSAMQADSGWGRRQDWFEYVMTGNSSGYAEVTSADEIEGDLDTASGFDNPAGASIYVHVQNVSFDDTMGASSACLPLVAHQFVPGVPQIPNGAQGVVIVAQVYDATGTVAYPGAEIVSEVIPLLSGLQANTSYSACVQIGDGWAAPFAAGIFRITYVFQM